MKYYAIADLHGRYDLLMKSFEAIFDDCKKHPEDDYTIITLGDYIDRGPESNEIIATLIAEQKQLPLICLKGNHEDMAVQVCSNPTWNMVDWWMGNGGAATIRSYDPNAYTGEVHQMDPEHLKWMANLPLYYETPGQVFVHAGIPYVNAPLEEQDKEKLIWMLYGRNEAGGWGETSLLRPKHVVHGHHQFADGPHEWEFRTDLDTFAWNTGRIVIGVFDDTQGKAIEYIEVVIK